jgi:hypothetical protein
MHKYCYLIGMLVHGFHFILHLKRIMFCKIYNINNWVFWKGLSTCLEIFVLPLSLKILFHNVLQFRLHVLFELIKWCVLIQSQLFQSFSIPRLSFLKGILLPFYKLTINTTFFSKTKFRLLTPQWEHSPYKHYLLCHSSKSPLGQTMDSHKLVVPL